MNLIWGKKDYQKTQAMYTIREKRATPRKGKKTSNEGQKCLNRDGNGNELIC